MKQPRFWLAIRHKPSGGFLPQMSSYGFTRTEPSTSDPPRLFVKHGAAKQALDRWLQGAWYEAAYNEDSGTQDVRVVRQAHRRADEMEIVEIETIARTLSEAELRRL